MASMSESGDRTALVAIAGNPNVGKTSVFNRLTGSKQKVTNYPGVTVERFEGSLPPQGGGEVRVIDVPGTYSLSARSREEEIAIRAIAGLGGEEQPDLVVLVADATQLSRNLYLALQVQELGVPLLVAVTMSDLCDGSSSDVAALAEAFGVPAVAVSGLTGEGIDNLQREIRAALGRPAQE